jgi:hypothetical protein
MTTAAPVGTDRLGYLQEQLQRALVAPIKAFKLVYLPLLMIYFAYGALGLVAVAETFWVRKALTLSPADLAALAVWLTLPWAIKMVFGELVDTVPILGSQRRIYVFIGAGMIAASLLLLAGTAAGEFPFADPNSLYIAVSLLSVVGIVLQDVVADAMSTEVVPRTEPDGTPRPKADIDRDLGMVQVLGRLALSLGIFVVAGISGWLAHVLPYYAVFLLGLVIPVISVSGAVLVRLETSERRSTDWRVLGGGLAFGAAVMLIALTNIPFNQELTFVISMAVVCTMLVRVTAGIEAATRKRIFYAALIIYVFRATPGTGEGFRWFAIDRLGFDEAFFGVLQQTGAALGLAAAWLLSDAITRQPVARVLLWLTIAMAILGIPNLMLVYGIHEWTEQAVGLGARGIALIDAAAASPLLQVSMIPLLTLTAIYAPPSHRATWFALMASFMNLALIAAQLQTKYLNVLFAVDRGAYDRLPVLVLTVVVIGLVVPLAAILWLGKRIR